MKRTVITLFTALALVLSTFAFAGGASAQSTYVPYVGDVAASGGAVSGASAGNGGDSLISANGDRYDVAKATAVQFGGAAVESAPAHAAAAASGGSGGGHSAGGGLAVTGSETTTPVILGAALIAIGGLAVISSKRREIAS